MSPKRINNNIDYGVLCMSYYKIKCNIITTIYIIVYYYYYYYFKKLCSRLVVYEVNWLHLAVQKMLHK